MGLAPNASGNSDVLHALLPPASSGLDPDVLEKSYQLLSGANLVVVCFLFLVLFGLVHVA